MKREMGLMLAAFACGAALAAGGKSDMPTLNWIGRRDAVRVAKDTVMKILREDRTLSYRAGELLPLRGVSESRRSRDSESLQNSKTPSSESNHKSTVLGIHDGVAYALLYNGVLHDRSYAGGNVLTPKTRRIIQEDLGRCGGGDGAPPSKIEKIVVYAECTRLGEAKLKEAKVEFRQTPYDIVAGR